MDEGNKKSLWLQEQASEDDMAGEQQGTGIVLRRKKKSEGSSPTKAGDAFAIAELVQKLCQVCMIESCCHLLL